MSSDKFEIGQGCGLKGLQGIRFLFCATCGIIVGSLSCDCTIGFPKGI